MWVFEEQVDGKNLTEIINTEHENVKYLPVRTHPFTHPSTPPVRAVDRSLSPTSPRLQGIKFTDNVVADPDLASACTDATLLVFVLPHQFLGRICPQMTTMANGCRCISLIKVRTRGHCCTRRAHANGRCLSTHGTPTLERSL